MPRTSVTAYDSQDTATRELTVPALDVANNYSLLERDTEEGTTVLNNLMGDPSLQEFVSYKYSPLNKVSTHPKMKSVYDPSTKDGYQIVIKDEWIRRITETDGTVHDDPEVVYLVYRTTRGNVIDDGTAVVSPLMRIIGAAMSLGEDTDALSTDMLDRLIHGTTIPKDVR